MADESRRSFLKRGLLGSALLVSAGALGGLGLSLWPTLSITPQRPLVILNATELSIVAALAETITPGTDPIAVAHRVDSFISSLEAPDQRDVQRLLHLVESALFGLVLDGRARPFSRATIAQRTAALGRMRDSRVTLRRGGYQVLRRLIGAARWTDEAAWPTLGYVGPPQLVIPT